MGEGETMEEAISRVLSAMEGAASLRPSRIEVTFSPCGVVVDAFGSVDLVDADKSAKQAEEKLN